MSKENNKVTKKEVNKRKYNIGEKYKLWIDTANKCPICADKICYIKNTEQNELVLKKTKSAQLTSKHVGEIAHIISLNNLKDKKTGKPIRPNNIDYKIEEIKFAKTKGKYDERNLNSYNNLLVLCSSCHKKIDGISNEVWIHSSLSDEEQVKKLIKIKQDNEVKDKTLNISKFSEIVISGKEDFQNAEEFLSIFESSEEINSLEIKVSDMSFNLDAKYHEAVIKFDKRIKDTKLNKNLKEFYNSISEGDEEKIVTKIQLKYFNNYYYFVITFTGSSKFVTERKTKEQLKEKLKNDIKIKNASWITNSTKLKNSLSEKTEYQLIEELLFKSLTDFVDDGNSKEFDSFSLAYMARWGTGKTSLIRAVMKQHEEYFTTVEINLWHIANSLPKDGMSTSDNAFVRQIVKEALTQLSNDESVASKFIDSMNVRNAGIADFDLKKKMLDSLLEMPHNTEAATLISERSKFLDQFISVLVKVSNTMFHVTMKPTVFIFDDLDRIEDEAKVVEILDSLVSFLSLKNAVYIIPVDEAKVMKAIAKSKKGKDPYSYMNKYFTYSIRAPFIPRLNSKSNIENIMNDYSLEVSGDVSEKSLWLQIASSLFPTSYRGIKDYLNVYMSTKKILENNNFFNQLIINSRVNDRSVKREVLYLVIAVIQIKYPLLVDHLSEGLQFKESLFKSIINTDKDSDLTKLIDFVKNDGKSDDANKNSSIETKSTKFWSALISRDLEEKEISNLESLYKMISSEYNDGSSKSIDKELKNLVLESLEYLHKIFTIHPLRNPNSNFKLLMWGGLTLAEINDSNAIEFVEQTDYLMQLTETGIERNADWDIAKQNRFIKKIEQYFNDGFIDAIQKDKIFIDIVKGNLTVMNEENIDIGPIINELKMAMFHIDWKLDHSVFKNFFTNHKKTENMTKLMRKFTEDEQFEKMLLIVEDQAAVQKFATEYREFITNFGMTSFVIELPRVREELMISIVEKKLNINIMNPLPLESKDSAALENVELVIKVIAEHEDDISINGDYKYLKQFNNKVLSNVNFANHNNLSRIFEINDDFTNMETFSIVNYQILFNAIFKRVEDNVEKFSKDQVIDILIRVDSDGVYILPNFERLFNVLNKNYDKYESVFEFMEEIKFDVSKIKKTDADLVSKWFISQFPNYKFNEINVDLVKAIDVVLDSNNLKSNLLKLFNFKQIISFAGEPVVANTPIANIENGTSTHWGIESYEGRKTYLESIFQEFDNLRVAKKLPEFVNGFLLEITKTETNEVTKIEFYEQNQDPKMLIENKISFSELDHFKLSSVKNAAHAVKKAFETLLVELLKYKKVDVKTKTFIELKNELADSNEQFTDNYNWIMSWDPLNKDLVDGINLSEIITLREKLKTKKDSLMDQLKSSKNKIVELSKEIKSFDVALQSESEIIAPPEESKSLQELQGYVLSYETTLKTLEENYSQVTNRAVLIQNDLKKSLNRLEIGKIDKKIKEQKLREIWDSITTINYNDVKQIKSIKSRFDSLILKSNELFKSLFPDFIKQENIYNYKYTEILSAEEETIEKNRIEELKKEELKKEELKITDIKF